MAAPPPDAPVVRPGRPEDAEVAAALLASLAGEHGLDRPLLTASAWRRQGFGPKRLFEPLVAELGGRPAGIALLTRGYDSQTAQAGVVLEDLYVEPLSRRRGVGRALLAAAARIARDEGGGWVAWHVRRDNVRAQLFYRALGAESEPVELMAVAGADFDRLAGT